MFGKKIMRVFLISCLLAYLFCVEDVSAAPIRYSIKSTASSQMTSKSVKTKAVEKTVVPFLRMTTEPGMQSTNINSLNCNLR